MDEEEYNFEEEKQIEQETKYHLEKLIRITYAIKQVYEILLFLYVNESLIKDFEDNKSAILNKLSTLKKQEEELYDYYKEDYTRATYALNYLEANEENNKNMTTKDLICYDRIHDRLAAIEIDYGIEQDFENNIEDLKEYKKFSLLLKAGYDEYEAAQIYLDYSNILDTSISTRYASLLQEEISKGIKPFIYIKELLDESFKSPNELENNLLNCHFNNLPHNLCEELMPSYEINPDLILEFIRIEIDNRLLEVLNNINLTKNEREFKILLIEFKTYLLYLTNNDIKHLIGMIEAWIQDETLREDLTKLTYDAKKYQDMQDVDSKKGRNY